MLCSSKTGAEGGQVGEDPETQRIGASGEVGDHVGFHLTGLGLEASVEGIAGSMVEEVGVGRQVPSRIRERRRTQPDV